MAYAGRLLRSQVLQLLTLGLITLLLRLPGASLPYFVSMDG
jgi:hypothetical protein